ncbi:hypothetical protein QL285_012931 [Trifolium repens]|nr:hypothetical protein QL285_012931 [Trifolium repens]
MKFLCTCNMLHFVAISSTKVFLGYLHNIMILMWYINSCVSLPVSISETIPTSGPQNYIAEIFSVLSIVRVLVILEGQIKRVNQTTNHPKIRETYSQIIENSRQKQ